MPRLSDKYKKEIVPALMRDFGYSNVMQVPKVVKVSVNMGLGEAVQNPKIIDGCLEELAVFLLCLFGDVGPRLEPDASSDIHDTFTASGASGSKGQTVLEGPHGETTERQEVLHTVPVCQCLIPELHHEQRKRDVHGTEGIAVGAP